MSQVSREDVTDEDIEFVERAVARVNHAEGETGGPRFSEDVVSVVRNLVTATSSLEKTVANIVTVLDGKALGDRTDGIVFRLGRLERRQAVALGLAAFVAARIGWIEWQGIAKALGTLLIH